MWNSAPIVSGVIASASGTPPARNARRIAFVARVRPGRPRGQPAGELEPLGVEVGVGDDPVDDAPLVQERRLVEAGREDELGRPCGAGALRHSLSAARARSQADVRLDQPDPGGFGRPDQIGAEGELEPPREAHAVEQRHRRDLERLEPVDERQQAVLAPAALVDHPLEQVHVDPAGEQLALGAPDERAGVGGLDLRDARLEGVLGLVAEQVERRVLEHHDGDIAVTLEPDGRAQETASRCAESGGVAQRVGLVRLLPGEVVVLAAEVAVGRGLLVDRTVQVEVLAERARTQVELVVDELARSSSARSARCRTSRPSATPGARRRSRTRPGSRTCRRARPRPRSWRRSAPRTRRSGPPSTGPCPRTRRHRGGPCRRRCR